VREIRVPFSHFSLCKAALDCPWPSSTTLPGQRQLSASHAVFRRCQASARYATPAGSNAISPIARSTSGAAIPRARGPPRCGRRNSRLAIPTPTPSGTIDSSGAQGRVQWPPSAQEGPSDWQTRRQMLAIVTYLSLIMRRWGTVNINVASVKGDGAHRRAFSSDGSVCSSHHRELDFAFWTATVTAVLLPHRMLQGADRRQNSLVHWRDEARRPGLNLLTFGQNRALQVVQ